MSIYLGNTEIGQIYLGATEIATAYLGSTKVFDAGGGSGGGYVTNGLVFHLDGIDKGTSDPTKWVDLVGGITFTEQTGANVHGTNKISLSSTNWMVGDSMPSGFVPSTHTIEIAVNKPNYGWYGYISFQSGGIGIKENNSRNFGGANGGGGYIFNRSSSDPWGKLLISFAKDLAICNCITQTTSSGNINNQNNTLPVIGSIKQGTISYGKDCDFYSIRIYSRLLSSAEIIQNQQHDNERFELGLTL